MALGNATAWLAELERVAKPVGHHGASAGDPAGIARRGLSRH